MKKLLATLLLGTALTAAALPAAAAGSDGTVTMQADGDRVSVSLAVPEGADQGATALRLSFQVEGGDAKASFVFDDGLTSAVQESRYEDAADILTIYVAGNSALLDGGSLDLGEIQLTSEKGATATVRVVEDSLELVNGALSKAGVTGVAGNAVSVTVPGTATDPGDQPTQPTPQPSAEPTPSPEPPAASTPTPKPPVESTPTPQPTQKPSEGGSSGGNTGGSSAGGNTSGGSSGGSSSGSSSNGGNAATPAPVASTSPVGTAAPVTAAQQPAASGQGSSGSKPSAGKATPAPSASPTPSATPQASTSPAPSATPETPAASATPEQAQPAQDAPLGLPVIALLVVAGLAAVVLIGVLVVRFRNR